MCFPLFPIWLKSEFSGEQVIENLQLDERKERSHKRERTPYPGARSLDFSDLEAYPIVSS